MTVMTLSAKKKLLRMIVFIYLNIFSDIFFFREIGYMSIPRFG